MRAVTVTLARGEEERELGTFNQGVVVEAGSAKDVATTEVIAFIAATGTGNHAMVIWVPIEDTNEAYDRLFIQAADE